jgi:hypothetical protein
MPFLAPRAGFAATAGVGTFLADHVRMSRARWQPATPTVYSTRSAAHPRPCTVVGCIPRQKPLRCAGQFRSNRPRLEGGLTARLSAWSAFLLRAQRRGPRGEGSFTMTLSLPKAPPCQTSIPPPTSKVQSVLRSGSSRRAGSVTGQQNGRRIRAQWRRRPAEHEPTEQEGRSPAAALTAKSNLHRWLARLPSYVNVS